MKRLKIRIPTSDEAVEFADWLEGEMIIECQSKVSRSKLRRYLRDLMYLGDEDLELRIEFIFEEMLRRRQSAGDLYPFVLQGTGVEFLNAKETLLYVFLLCLSIGEDIRSKGRQNEVEMLFDNVVQEALCQYFGERSTGMRFGWPPSGDRPSGFSEAIAWLSAILGLPIGKGKQRPKSKDAGVDIVVWKPFRDRRQGCIIILAQCTIAFDWFPKAKDIFPDVWRGWIDFGKDPITCLAIPFVIPHSFEKWDELRRTVNIVLDRLRICELLEGIVLRHEMEVEEFTYRELSLMGGEED